MCGRFVAAAPLATIALRFEVDENNAEERPPDYNVAPRADVMAVRRRDRDGGNVRVLSRLRWGLVPSWAKSPAVGDRLINARAETITDAPSYRAAFVKRRCIIPADGFYEWHTLEVDQGRTRRQPMFVHRRDGDLLAFAGLWEAWKIPGSEAGFEAGPEPGSDPVPASPVEWLRSCVIVTTRANDAIAPAHDRMPVLLAEADWDAWLDPTRDPETLRGLLRPSPPEWLEVYPVSTAVNRAANNSAELIRRLDPSEDP